MIRSLLLSLLVLTACADPMPSSEPTIVEAQSPAIDSAKGTIIEAVGLETLGGVFTPLLEVDCRIPCEKTEIFSTASDNQDQVTIALYRGSATMVRDATPLGKFRITGIPPLARGEPQVEVTLAARGSDLLLEAKDLTTFRQYKIVKVVD